MLAVVITHTGPAPHGSSLLHTLFGWFLLALLGYLIFRWLRTKRQAQAAAMAGAAAAASSTSGAASESAAAGGNAGANAGVVVNLGAGADHNGAIDYDKLGRSVALYLAPLLRTGLPDDDQHYRPLDHDHQQPATALDVPSSDRPRRGRAADGATGRSLPSGAAPGRPARTKPAALKVSR